MKKSSYIVYVFLLSSLLCSVVNFTYSQVSFSGCYISGALLDPGSTAGCGNSGTNNYCNLASLYVPAFSPTACATFTSGSGVSHTKATVYTLPSGCTATIQAEYRKRNYLGVGATATGCSNSGMDGSPDALYIVQSGGTISSQGFTIDVNVGTCGAYPALGVYTGATSSISPGCTNADGYVQMIVTGGTFTVGGVSNRADEIITYTINMAGSCGPLCSSVLPIELVSFYGTALENKVKLQWKVASELNVDYYLVEKSIDGSEWTALGKVKANSETFGVNQLYHLSDHYPQKGVNYYRLNNYDKDDKRGEAKLIAVNFNKETMPIWVEQTNEDLIFHLNENNKMDEAPKLYDVSGRLIMQLHPENSGSKIVVSKQLIEKGIYLLGFVSSGNSYFNQLLIH